MSKLFYSAVIILFKFVESFLLKTWSLLLFYQKFSKITGRCVPKRKVSKLLWKYVLFTGYDIIYRTMIL